MPHNAAFNQYLHCLPNMARNQDQGEIPTFLHRQELRRLISVDSMSVTRYNAPRYNPFRGFRSTKGLH